MNGYKKYTTTRRTSVIALLGAVALLALGCAPQYDWYPCGSVPLEYCPPAPLPYSGYSACPTPMAMRYWDNQPEQAANSELPPIQNSSDFQLDEPDR